MGMSSCAPNCFATSSAKGLRVIAITRAPAFAASRVTSAPRNPIPTIATVCPARSSLRRKMFIAHPSGSPGTGCPASASGSFTVSTAGTTQYSANARPESVATRSPTRSPVTPSPSRSTTPQPS